MEKMKGDKNCEQGYRQFLDLITPGSKVIYGDFNRLNDLGFIIDRNIDDDCNNLIYKPRYNTGSESFEFSL